MKEGLFEDALFGYPCVNPEEIKKYDILNDVKAHPVAFEKYGHIDYREGISPALNDDDYRKMI